ncbi:uncharacterized protein LOC129721186 isoform X2 [Wyeomyia smithii]|nr:uncharacterized protein LOC129721186 isoform X2 [Wyeomyia smithii]XP_055529438.1 uncharacterized protein LOC129721186 isoform X2 [Wyeomyia smithii]XP_055529439.1 uncharacterized protein LOC129721186 isoform X2 [Wyeomyia smithii]XP_055529440.1 uncharacterized protein LOC129721186 isoform X2 [Wyeomyia smithii]XP_055529442.1 uncharacterized protein LOC129721186 isoform X2 [Wyeomyia smithii]XP_055529443.1 uncharacterized protein LOC129721186 isoform X2 [Wyeomyia smithii]
MTKFCSPWDYSLYDDNPVEGYARLSRSFLISGKDMDDMLMQCTKNSVYVLNSSYRYRDFDTIELFGSPAGRALTVNNKTSAETHPCSKPNSSANNSITIATKCISCMCTTNQNHPLHQHRLFHPLYNCSFSETCNITNSNGLGCVNACNGNFVEYSDLIRHRSPVSHPHPQRLLPEHSVTNYNKGNRTNSKIAKIWKLFDEDRIHKGTSKEENQGKTRNCTSNGNNGLSGNNAFSRCQNKSSTNSVPQEEKSTKDLYSEAAQLLGMNCTLSDSCRCIDCQSQYFECDDFDSYSEYSDKSCDMEESLITNQSCYAANPDNYPVGKSPQENVTSVTCQPEQYVSTNSNQKSVLGDSNHAKQLSRRPDSANVNFTCNTTQDSNGNEPYYSLNDSTNDRELLDDKDFSVIQEKNCKCSKENASDMDGRLDLNYTDGIPSDFEQIKEKRNIKT